MSNNSECELKPCPMNEQGAHWFINSKNGKQQYCKLCGCMKKKNNNTRNNKRNKRSNNTPKFPHMYSRKNRKNSRRN